MSSAMHTERGRIASLSRSRPADDPELVTARRNLKAITLEEHVRKVVAAAPPLSSDQVDRIVTILRGGAR